LWGWLRAAEWADQLGRGKDQLAAAEALVRLAPGQAVSHGHLCAARLRVGDRDGAKAALARSLEVDPSYRYGAETLLALQFEDDQMPAAAETLAIIEQHQPKAVALVCR